METLKTIWDFFQNEVLGMNWLNRLIETFLNACGLDTTGKIGGSVQFFIYDTVKIMVLLGVLILIISYIQSYFPPERAKKILGRFHGIWANIIAALLGTVTPFCSCSSIPLFIGFTSAGLPLGVTFSFLISSPMVDLGSLVLLMSIFGWKVAVLYVIFGLVIAVAGGTLIEKLHLDNQVEEYIRNGHSIDVPQEELHFKDRMKFAWEQVVETAKKVAPYVLIGVGIGAFIHNWIPEEFIVKALGENNPFGVILATIVGIPMYADIFGTIPIAEALLAKGALLGVVLSFMMGVTTLSLPSMIMLRKAVKPKLLGIFIGICAAGIIIVILPVVGVGQLPVSGHPQQPGFDAPGVGWNLTPTTLEKCLVGNRLAAEPVFVDEQLPRPSGDALDLYLSGGGGQGIHLVELEAIVQRPVVVKNKVICHLNTPCCLVTLSWICAATMSERVAISSWE